MQQNLTKILVNGKTFIGYFTGERDKHNRLVFNCSDNFTIYLHDSEYKEV